MSNKLKYERFRVLMAVIMNVCVGSWQSGRSRVYLTFPQALFLFFWLEFPGKFTMDEGGVSASQPSLDAFLKVLSRINLTIHKE